MNKYKNILTETFKYIEQNYNVTSFVQIFGELFGGNYPVPKLKQLGTCVQKQVYYYNDNDFMCFDILVDNNYLNFDQVLKICEINNLPHVPVLEIGDYKTIYNKSPIFETKIYEKYGLPQLQNNFAEGFVMKPVNEYLLDHGNRCILKCKNPKFIEISQPKKPIDKTISTNSLIEELSCYINKNRIQSVHSKYGKIPKKELWQYIIIDAIEEYEKMKKPIENKNEIIKELINKYVKK